MTRLNFTLDQEDVKTILLSKDSGELKALKEAVLNQILKAEAAEQIGAEYYERSPDRTTQRNGTRIRTLTTRVGSLVLHVPKFRNGTFSTELFARYSRSERAFQLALIEMVIQGVSTRKVTEITEVLCGTAISKSTVSRLCSELDAPIRSFRERPLDRHYPFLVVDAMYVKVRERGRIVSKGLLIALGISESGHREVLAFDYADSESYESWRALFKGLRARGIEKVDLIVSDDHTGLVQALHETFHGTMWQRCQTHFSRNLNGSVPRALQPQVKALLTDLYNSPTREAASARKDDLLDTLSAHGCQKAHDLLDEAFADITAIFSLPPSYRRKLRTTNMIERLNEELRRRERVIRIFPNADSVLRLLGAILLETHEQWISGRAYTTMDRYELDRQEMPHANLTIVEKTAGGVG
jgi:putative transposase